MEVREGQKGGSSRVVLTPAQMPAHAHGGKGASEDTHTHTVLPHEHNVDVFASTSLGDTPSPQGASLSTFPEGVGIFADGPPNSGSMANGTLRVLPNSFEATGEIDSQTQPSGSLEPVNLRSPYTALNFCMVMEGTLPQRN